MKKLLLLTCFVLSVSVAVSTATAQTQIGRQQKEDNRVYVVIDVAVKDVQMYDEWLALEKSILESFGGEEIMDVRSQDQKRRYIINAFPDQKSIDDFVTSDAFQEIFPMNKEAADTKVFRGYLHK